MRRIATLCCTLPFLCACMTKGPHPDDPYEAFNRKTYRFNQQLDRIILKPVATLYSDLVPNPVRSAIHRVYQHINLCSTIANDVLQGQLNQAIQDSWRLWINSTLGLGGLWDPASQCQLPPHTNDMGLTFAKWGDRQSPYLVLPFLGPSTIRDGMGLLFDTLFTPYFYIPQDPIIYGVLGLRYVDLRASLFDTETILAQAMDDYTLMRDAYLQNRRYLIEGTQPVHDASDLYVED